MKTISILIALSLLCIGVYGQKNSVLDLTPLVFEKKISYSDNILNIIRIEDTVKKRLFKDSVKIVGCRIQTMAEFGPSTFIKGGQFSRSSFKEHTSFGNSLFLGEADFMEAKFEKQFNATSSVFKGNALFIGATFDEAYFGQDTFYAYAEFWNCNFKKSTSFWPDVVFNKQAYFTQSTFEDRVEFANAIFEDTANFKGVKTSIDIGFTGTTFKKHADFRNAIIKGKIYFGDSRFYETLDLTYLNLDSATFSFRDATLPDTINFYKNPKIANDIDLSVANFKDPARYDSTTGEYLKHHYINLFNSDISKFHFDYIHFRLLLIDPYTQTELPTEEANFLYEAVLKNFKDRGQWESYEILDKEYQRFKGRNSFLKWRSWLPSLWWGYGYDKELIFLNSLILLLFFTTITFFSLNKLNGKHRGVYHISNIPEYVPRNKWKRLWFSFMYTATIFFLLTLKIDKINYHRKLGTFYVLLVYSVGLLCLGYIANFVFQK